MKMKKNQQRIEMIFDAKKIPYKKLDIAADEDLKKRMREISNNPKALPPQLCNGDAYCGVSQLNCSNYLWVGLIYNLNRL